MILHLGLIALLFPRARIVLCRRDLRDVCLRLSLPELQPRHAVDQRPGRMRHSGTGNRTLDPPLADGVAATNVAEVCYEDLVVDLEGESRRLIDFLGLPWNPACLDFHNTERQVMTASLWQVRQPLFTGSVGRWRHYARHLSPLLSRLADGLPEAEAVP